jgi:hypothetical protein
MTYVDHLGRPDEIDESMLVRAWQLLDSSWNKLTPLQSYGSDGTLSEEEVTRFVCGWQVCHSVAAHCVVLTAVYHRCLSSKLVSPLRCLFSLAAR